MSDEIVSGSQTETTTQDSETVTPETDAETEALYAEFGMPPKKEEEQQKSEEGDPPAKEETPTEPKKITVKFNKEDVEVDVSDDKLPEYVQKALALDKERERVKQSQTDLDRAAKLLGYKDHADLSTNLDKIEQDRQQQQKDQFDQLKQGMVEEYQRAGYDPAHLEQWLENHPLLTQAREAVQEREQVQQERQKAAQDETWNKGWTELYTSFPELVEDSKKFDSGGRAEFYSPDMESMVKRGLTPKEAYTLLNMDKIQTQSAKKTEQKIIKQQHLGARSIVEGQAASQPDEVTLLPEQMALASEFGVNLDGVRQQQKLLNSRR